MCKGFRVSICLEALHWVILLRSTAYIHNSLGWVLAHVTVLHPSLPAVFLHCSHQRCHKTIRRRRRTAHSPLNTNNQSISQVAWNNLFLQTLAFVLLFVFVMFWDNTRSEVPLCFQGVPVYQMSRVYYIASYEDFGAHFPMPLDIHLSW